MSDSWGIEMFSIKTCSFCCLLSFGLKVSNVLLMNNKSFGIKVDYLTYQAKSFKSIKNRKFWLRGLKFQLKGACSVPGKKDSPFRDSS